MEFSIISGGQSGVDRAALDVAWEFGLGRGGWCPHGRVAEDGPIDPQYDLTETPSAEFEERTTWNVRDATATLIITPGDPVGGTLYTLEACRRLGKPHLVVNPDDPKAPSKATHWIANHEIAVLNVAGPRESTYPGIYGRAKDLLREMLTELKDEAGGDFAEF